MFVVKPLFLSLAKNKKKIGFLYYIVVPLRLAANFHVWAQNCHALAQIGSPEHWKNPFIIFADFQVNHHGFRSCKSTIVKCNPSSYIILIILVVANWNFTIPVETNLYKSYILVHLLKWPSLHNLHRYFFLCSLNILGFNNKPSYRLGKKWYAWFLFIMSMIVPMWPWYHITHSQMNSKKKSEEWMKMLKKCKVIATKRS